MHTKNKLVETVELLAIILLVQNQEVLGNPNIIEQSKPDSVSETVTIRICSKFLSQRLADLCDKRETSPLLDIIVPKKEEPNRRPRAVRLSRRSRRQISDECCNNACTLEHMMSYCPPNSPVYYR